MTHGLNTLEVRDSRCCSPSWHKRGSQRLQEYHPLSSWLALSAFLLPPSGGSDTKPPEGLINLSCNTAANEDDPHVSVSEEMKAAAKSYQDSWNRTSDPFVGLVKGFAESAAGAGASLFSGLFGRQGGGPGNGGSGSGSGGSGSGSGGSGSGPGGSDSD